MVEKMIKNFMGTMIGIPLISASAGMTSGLSPGLAKDITGTAVGLQSVALVGHTIKGMPKFPKGKLKW